MINVVKQVAYWRDGAIEDWEVANELVASSRTRHGSFFAHLALDKMLKAHVCRETQSVPPKIHNLLLLAPKAKLPLSDMQEVFLGRFDKYQLEGRYATPPAKPTVTKARQEMASAEEFLQWLTKQF